MQKSELFIGSFVAQASLLSRLRDSVTEAWDEIRGDPKKFIKSAIRNDGGGGRRRKMLLRMGLALGISIYAVLMAAAVLLGSFHSRKTAASNARLEEVRLFNPTASRITPPEAASPARKPSGGGGGGDGSNSAASGGSIPLPSLTESLIAPTTKPQLLPPALPMVETILVDPRLLRRDEVGPTGVPPAPMGPPSDGPGSNKGIGTGGGGGIGSGRGRGFGPGEDGGRGGGPNRGPGSNPGVAILKVDALPQPLNSPRPNYTEEARRNKVQGLVRTKVLVGADGLVKRVTVVSGLPDGLDQEAIRAAYQMRFRPARKEGVNIEYWMTVEIEFNLR
jgi:TonB family protein